MAEIPGVQPSTTVSRYQKQRAKHALLVDRRAPPQAGRAAKAVALAIPPDCEQTRQIEGEPTDSRRRRNMARVPLVI